MIRDTDDPKRLREIAWGHAITQWQGGDGEPLRALLSGRAAVPSFAREFLADLVAGKAPRRQGRPADRSPEHKRRIWAAVMVEMDGGKSQADAIAIVAYRQRLDDDGAVRRIVGDMTKEGLTRAVWTEKMRPR